MPKIAIIGRQNVGKSTLFNALIGKRRAIIYNEPGSTRDIITHPLDWGAGSWELSDFPGLEDLKKISSEELVYLAITKALTRVKDYHLLLWVVTRKGLSKYEYLFHEQLRKMLKPYWLIINFVDDPSLEIESSELYKLGVKETFFISALNQRNLKKLTTSIKSYFSLHPKEEEKDDNNNPSFAIIGKPNAGKSTLYNLLLQKELALISSIPGTTRDSLEAKFLFHKNIFYIIDTAGLKRNTNSLGQIDKLAELRTFESMQKADVIIFLIDPEEGFDRQNKNLMSYINELKKPVVLAINKSDIFKYNSKQREQFRQDVKDFQTIFWKFPTYFISAKEGNKVVKIIEASIKLYKKSQQKYSTPKLNTLIQNIKNEPILVNHKIKLFYITQLNHKTEFILFINNKSIPFSIKKFLIRKIQNFLSINDLPVDIRIRERPRKQKL